MDLIASEDAHITCTNESQFTSQCHTVLIDGLQNNICSDTSATAQTSQQAQNYLDQYLCPSPSLSDIDFENEGITSVDFSSSFLDQILQENNNNCVDAKTDEQFLPFHVKSTASSEQTTNPSTAASLCQFSSSFLQAVQTSPCNNSVLSQPPTYFNNGYDSNFKNLTTAVSDSGYIDSWNHPDYSYDNSTAYQSVQSSGYYSCLMSSMETSSQENQTQSQTELHKPTAETSNMLKPKESFIALVAKAMLSTADNSMVLNEVYQWILDNYPYFQTAKCAWRSSVRHSLSVNECFVKGKRAKNGRGFVWSIHPMCIDSFKKGDFDRRTARRIVQHSTRAITSAVQELEKLAQTVQSTSQPQRYQACVPPHPISSTPVRNHTGANFYNGSYNNDSMNYSSISKNTPDCRHNNYSSPYSYGYF